MKLEIFEAPQQAAAAAAERIAACVRAKPAAVLGLATGATMEEVYRSLVARLEAERLSLGQVTTFNLDEYLGLAAEDPASYRATMRRLLFGLSDLDPARTHLPRGEAPAPPAEASRYEAAIAAAGGLDLQLLGLGRNGHVGFNEPGSPADSRTRVVRLSATPRKANRRPFPPGRAVAERALTVG
ncbi:MAG: 6-phosphogluconolactonase, partial [Tistlia sp.]